MTPPSPSQPAGQDPDVDRHAFDVDAGHGSERAVVGNGAHRLAQAGASQEQGGKRCDNQRDGDGDGLAGR
jgi:hypothetical protein